MEWWNIGMLILKGNFSSMNISNFYVKVILPIDHYAISSKPIIPQFQ